LGASELASDPRFIRNPDRVRHRSELIGILQNLCQKFSRDTLLAALEEEGVPAGPINTLSDVFADPQVVARRMRLDLADAAAKGGLVPSVRSPIVFDGEPAAAGRASPEVGADTAEILADPAWGGGGQAA
jgi:crotonobetainyl-CoA:carnitine CoA-transferase CaiB-like acyl-CoA transferase